MVEITTHLLTGDDPDQTLRRMVHHARSTSGADGASLCLPTDEPGTVRVAVAEGVSSAWQDDIVAVEGTAAGAAIAEGRPVLIADLSADPRTTASALRAPGVVEAVAAVPTAAGDQVIGVLLVVRSPGNGTFDEVDLELIHAYATQAGVALQLAQARLDSEQLRTVEDRQHIAEDLHYRVIQRLFALGLSLQGLAPRVANPALGATINGKVDEIDAVIRDIRAVVFSLNRPEAQEPPG
jgi:GAF domain-containing protein